MAKKLVIPWELKYDFAIKGYTGFVRGVISAIRKECGAAATLKILEKVWKMDDRIKNITNKFLEIFKIEGNDAETIAKWWEIWFELCGTEYSILELSKTMSSFKVTKCPFKVVYEDTSEWVLPFCDIVGKTINSKASLERPKAMCAGDPHCEYVYKIEE